MTPASRQHGRELELELAPLGALEVELGVAREVVVVAQLDTMLPGIERDAALAQDSRADEPAVDVDLRVGDVRLEVDDRVVRRYAGSAAVRAARDQAQAGQFFTVIRTA